MRFVTLDEYRDGDILAEDIFNKYGAVLVPQNTALNSYIICKLDEIGVQRLRVYDNKAESGCYGKSTGYRRLKEAYEGIILDIKSIINELAAGRPLNADRILEICDEVCCGIHSTHDILRILKEEKNFDEYTYIHSLNVAFYAMLIGKWLKLDRDSVRTAVKAGLLHDIGKMKIPVEILNKKDRLTEKEFEEIKKHTLYGYHMAKETKMFSEQVCIAILSYHERIDKSGYPFGIGCEKIDIFSKILAIADVFDAMTSDRVYKKRESPFKVFEMFKTEGVKDFDPKILNTFLNNVSVYYVGSKVLLNTGEAGEIVYIPPQSITEPVVRIGMEYVDLAQDRDRDILCMI